MGCFNSKKANKKAKPEPNQNPNFTNGALVVKNNKFISQALDSHNEYRTIHSSSKLKLNNDLCRIAQEWAERIASSNNFEHSSNIYMGQSLGIKIFTKTK